MVRYLPNFVDLFIFYIVRLVKSQLYDRYIQFITSRTIRGFKILSVNQSILIQSIPKHRSFGRAIFDKMMI